MNEPPHRSQFSLLGLLMITCALCVDVSIATSCFELRDEWRRSRILPALRQGHPYWESESGQRLLARQKMSVAEWIWTERGPVAYRFRVACAVAVAFHLLVALLCARDLVRRRSQRGTLHLGKEFNVAR